jgi:hypothetical protein
VDASTGIGAGGRMRQRIHPDPHGPGTWDPARSGRVFEPAPTPVSARTYSDHGLPRFERYDEARGDLPPSEPLGGVTLTR